MSWTHIQFTQLVFYAIIENAPIDTISNTTLKMFFHSKYNGASASVPKWRSDNVQHFIQ